MAKKTDQFGLHCSITQIRGKSGSLAPVPSLINPHHHTIIIIILSLFILNITLLTRQIASVFIVWWHWDNIQLQQLSSFWSKFTQHPTFKVHKTCSVSPLVSMINVHILWPRVLFRGRDRVGLQNLQLPNTAQNAAQLYNSALCPIMDEDLAKTYNLSQLRAWL